MKYVLDTNAVIHAIRGWPESVRDRLEVVGPAVTAVSAVTVAELWYGAEKSGRPGRHRLFEAFLAPFEILPFDEAAGRAHGVLRHELRHTPMGERDLLIAAIVYSRDLTVVTANGREFGRVRGLSVEDWSS